MEFRIAESFQTSLGKLTAQEQKAVKITAFDMQNDLTGNATQFHRIERTKDNNFWSARVNNDIRIIVHKTDQSIMMCYVDHHDNAYDWARRRRIENHPKTGAAQIVEVREMVEDIVIQRPVLAEEEPLKSLPPIFVDLNKDQLLSIGVPEDWIDDVLSADEESFLYLADHLPQEATEILLEVGSGDLSFQQAVARSHQVIEAEHKTGFDHPDAKRRFHVIEGHDDLALALDFPWEKWTVFLHPTQKIYAERDFSGPARIAGSAGTGKTVVAIHRAYSLHLKFPEHHILLTTFTKTLANAMQSKLKRLVGEHSKAFQHIHVMPLSSLAYELKAKSGWQPNIASDAQLSYFFKSACKELDIHDFSTGFLLAEWEHVVDAWYLTNWEDYRDVKRLGRKTRIGGSQREKLWSLFEYVWKTLKEKSLTTWSALFHELSQRDNLSTVYQHAVIDEAQDISVGELRFLSNLITTSENGLFFAGDLGQRIFRQPFSWRSLGIDVRGRSHTLNINYRTSHQIRQKADRLLPRQLSDMDEIEETRKATISLFNSLPPQILTVSDLNEETLIVSDWIKTQISEGIDPSEIGVFVRSEEEYSRAKDAIKQAKMEPFKLTDKFEENQIGISYGTMHLAKGLEFRSVAVIACDEDILPKQSRMELVTDASDLEEVYETERHLLYVACTRAREHLLIIGVDPSSEFIDDL